MDGGEAGDSRLLRYSVVIPSYNEGERLLQTVESILATATHPTEVIVVDDASTDGSATGLRGKPWRLSHVRVLRNNDRSGVAVSRATGMDAASGDWLICIDAHNTFPPAWQDHIEQAAHQLSGGYGYLLGPELHYGQNHLTGTYYPDPDLYPHMMGRQEQRSPYAVMSIPGACHIIRRDYYRAIGGYDRLMLPPWGGEDMELSLRVWMLGGECNIIPGLDIWTLLKDCFEYPMTHRITIGNVLRVAHLYLDDDRLEKHIETQIDHPSFRDAYRLMRVCGTMDRYEELRPWFRRTTDEVFERFGIAW